MADKPVTREEMYLAYLTGDYTGELPKPITRKEKYLYELCLKGMGGEVSPEEIKSAVNEYLEKNPVKPGATTEQAQQIEQNKTDIGSLKEDKITKPAEAPTIGKILRVKSVNEDGTFVCEWANGGSNLDVQIDGKSIVQDGVAEIPMVGNDKSGLIQFKRGYGLQLIGNYLLVSGATETEITNRAGVRAPILPNSTLDYAVKAAMCDGKGAAWTDTERIAALLRMGCTVDDNGFVKWTAQEVTE